MLNLLLVVVGFCELHCEGSFAFVPSDNRTSCEYQNCIVRHSTMKAGYILTLKFTQFLLTLLTMSSYSLLLFSKPQDASSFIQ